MAYTGISTVSPVWNSGFYDRYSLPKLPHPRRPRGSESGWEKRRDKGFQAKGRAPGYRLSPDHFQTPAPDRHEKCLVLLCPIGEQHLLISFCEIIHNGYWLNHGLSSSCTKEMHTVFSVSIVIILIAYLFKYKQTLLELNSYQPYPSSERERKFCHCLFTSSKNMKLGIFTWQSCSDGKENVQKSLMHM